MPQDDAKLRDAYAQLISRSASTTPRDAIPLERIRDLAEDRVQGDERARLLDAVLADPEARRELEILRALAAHRPRATQRLMWTGASALAAAAVLMLVWRNQHAREPDEMRGSRALVQVIAPASGATLESTGLFTWHRVAGATSYRLQIASDEGVMLYAARTTDTTATLPDSIRASRTAAAHWWIVAEHPDATELRSEARPIHGR